MKYDEIGPVSRAEATSRLDSEDPRKVVDALLGLALHESDWRYVQTTCLQLSEHPDVWVRRNVATALGHLARLHGTLDLDVVLPVLARMHREVTTRSWVENAYDDFEAFLGFKREAPG